MNDLPPRGDFLREVIAERNQVQDQLHDVRMRLAYLVGYWGNAGGVPIAEVREALELCSPPGRSRPATPES